tara:strand:+ start:86 stop:292 length:207 start_codon:yes stop_codon:yes gene_type:complete
MNWKLEKFLPQTYSLSFIPSPFGENICGIEALNLHPTNTSKLQVVKLFSKSIVVILTDKLFTSFNLVE